MRCDLMSFHYHKEFPISESYGMISPFNRMPCQTLDVKDIAEVRLGTHSIGFVRTGCTDKFREVSRYSNL